MPKGSQTKIKRDAFDDDLDALFRLPLAEFTGARNALSARLKKSGRGDDASRVKALAKPSISAWAVNQLYWNHRAAFDRLIASADRFHKAQASPGGGKIADMRTALDARREALTHLTDLATSLLRAGGQNPTPDTIHRITTTLEGISAYVSRSNAPRPGRLTHDVDPPGFESLASFVPAAGITRPAKEAAREPARDPAASMPSLMSIKTAPSARRKFASDNNKRQLEETRQTKIAAAKVSLHDARRSLAKARARAQSSEAAQKKADAVAKKAEMHRRDVERSLEKAKAAAEDAARRVRSVAAKLEEATTAMNDAERTVEKASQELESLSRESSGR